MISRKRGEEWQNYSWYSRVGEESNYPSPHSPTRKRRFWQGHFGEVNVLALTFISIAFYNRAKEDLDANLAVAHTWTEFNAMLDKQKVCFRSR